MIHIVRGRLAWVSKSEVGDLEISRLRDIFTLYPTKGADYGDSEGIIHAYEENTEYFGFPREAVNYAFGGVCAHTVEDKTILKKNIPFRVKVPAWPNQKKPIANIVSQLEKCGGTILKAPCGSGKTNIALLVAAKIKQPTLILVHKSFLMNQWRDRIKEVLGTTCGIIQQDKCSYKNHKISVGMLQSIATREDYPEDLLSHFGFVIIDENHRLGCISYDKAIRKFSAKYRLGLSVSGDSKLIIKQNGKIRCITIEELATENDTAPDTIVPLHNMEIRAHDGEKYEWKPITNIHKYSNEKECVQVECDYGLKLSITKDHSVFRVTPSVMFQWEHNNKKYFPYIEPVKGSELEEGDYLILDIGSLPKAAESPKIIVAEHMPDNYLVSGNFSELIESEIRNEEGYKNSCKIRYARKRGQFGSYLTIKEFNSWHTELPGCIYTSGGNGHLPTELSAEKIAWLLGFFLGDGWVSYGNLTFAVEEGFSGEFENQLQRLSSFSITYSKTKMKGASYEYRVVCAPLRKLLDSLNEGRKCHRKRIPNIVWSWSKKDIKLFVKGLLDSDGHCSKRSRNRSRFYYTTTSKVLAEYLQLLIIFSGTPAGIHERPPSLGGIINGRQIIGKRISYQVSWSANEWLDTDTKGRALGNKFNTGPDFGKLVKIKAINPAKENFVYDLSVADHENFSANGILVHNSATQHRKDGMDCLFRWHLGNVDTIIDRKENLAGTVYQVLMKKAVNLFKYKYGKGKTNFPKMISDTVAMRERQDYIAGEIKKMYDADRKILVLSDRKAHLADFEERLKKLNIQDYGYYIGAMKEKDLKRTSEKSIILATFAMAGEGLDIPELDTVILTSPKSDIEQAVGRIERECKGKKPLIVIDIVDPNPMFKHMANKRARQYTEIMTFNIKQIQL